MITHVSESELFKKKVAMVQSAKKVAQASRMMESKRDACATFLEELIDACVLELYFPDELHTAGLRLFDQVASLVGSMPPSGAPGEGTRPTVSAIESFYSTANAPSHPIRNCLDRLCTASPDLLAVIQQEGKV